MYIHLSPSIQNSETLRHKNIDVPSRKMYYGQQGLFPFSGCLYELRLDVTTDIHKNAFIIHALHFWMIVNVRMHCFIRSLKVSF